MARRSILLCVAFVIAALGTAMVILYVQGIEARATEGQALVEVLTATDVIKGGESVADARQRAYDAVACIDLPGGQYRQDIALGALHVTA